MAQGRLIIVCGLPGSGKTTHASAVAGATGGIRMCPDEWLATLGIDIWDEAMRARIEGLQWEQTQELLRAGATVIIEWGTWGRSEREVLRDGARALGARVELHYLDVPLDVLWARVQARGMEAGQGSRAIARADLEEWAGLIEVPDAAELATYDAPRDLGPVR